MALETNLGTFDGEGPDGFLVPCYHCGREYFCEKWADAPDQDGCEGCTRDAQKRLMGEAELRHRPFEILGLPGSGSEAGN